MTNAYPLLVLSRSIVKSRARRPLSASRHVAVMAESEREARLALVADYNKRARRVVRIERIP